MSNSIMRYPLDVTGVNPDNFVNSEIHVTTNKPVRAIALNYGAFFTESVKVYDNRTNQLLVRGVQYLCSELLQTVSTEYGKEICFLIILIDPNVNLEVRISYQTLGGLYGRSTDAITNIYESLQTDSRPVDWINVLNKPLEFNPSIHLHDIRDVFGFQYLVTALERVRSAIVISDIPAFESVLDWVTTEIVNIKAAQVISFQLASVHATKTDNPHNTTKDQLGLSNVQNLTLALGEDIVSILNAATNSPESIIPIDKYVTLKKLLQFKNNMATLIATSITNLTNTINASSSAAVASAALDATFKANAAYNSAVAVSETYSSNGANITSGTINIDRIPNFDYSKIVSGKPTTLGEYGITDAVSANAPITSKIATKVIYDSKGLITSGTILSPSDIPDLDYSKITSGRPGALVPSDIPNLDWTKISSGKPTTLGGYGITNAITANPGVSAATATKISYDANGLVVSSSNLVASDIPNLDWSKIISGKPTNLLGYGISDAIKANAPITAGTATKIGYDVNGLIVSGTTLSQADIPNLDFSKITSGKPSSLAGYGITDALSINSVISASTANSVAGTAPAGSTATLVTGSMANNDSFRIMVGDNGVDAGYVEIATADNGSEPIYVRQYNGAFATIVRTLALLDGSGNTLIPGAVIAESTGSFRGGISSITGGLSVSGDITSSSGKLTVFGDILSSSGNVTAYSDETLKENWRNVTTDFIAKWAKVKHGIYDRIDTKVTHAGLGAQSVQAILPEVVTKHEDGYLSLNYGAAAAIATVELADESVKQSNDIKMLVGVITRLEKRITELENR